MLLFSYEARNRTGDRFEGSVEAASRREAAQKIRQRGLWVAALRLQGERERRRGCWHGYGSVRTGCAFLHAVSMAGGPVYSFCVSSPCSRRQGCRFTRRSACWQVLAKWRHRQRPARGYNQGITALMRRWRAVSAHRYFAVSRFLLHWQSGRMSFPQVSASWCGWGRKAALWIPSCQNWRTIWSWP